MRNSNFLTAWVRLAFTPKVGPRTFEKLLKKFQSPIIVLENAADIKRRYKLELLPPSVSEIEDKIHKCNQFGAEILLSCENQYPELLRETEGHPPLLFAKGNLDLLNSQRFAIVGTRNSSINGEKITKQIANDIGKNGIVIVSGLARGIDAAAHYGSLETGTIGVIASGINCFYPRENEKLQNMLYEKGLVLSETMIDAMPISKNFPRRNRIISGLSVGVLVVEAMKDSGTMITANYALEQGREVFAVPGFPTDSRSFGTNFLIKNGAILVRDANDILNEIAYEKRSIGLESYLAEPSDNSDHIILSKLSNTPVDIEELLSSLSISLSELHQILIELEISGKIARQGNKVFII